MIVTVGPFVKILRFNFKALAKILSQHIIGPAFKRISTQHLVQQPNFGFKNLSLDIHSYKKFVQFWVQKLFFFFSSKTKFWTYIRTKQLLNFAFKNQFFWIQKPNFGHTVVQQIEASSVNYEYDGCRYVPGAVREWPLERISGTMRWRKIQKFHKKLRFATANHAICSNVVDISELFHPKSFS